MTLLAVLALGFFLGMRHATDADHVVAVSTIVTRERSPRAALMIGALWGLGHTATILVVGGAIVIFGVVIPPRLGLSMEMSVALMLIVLGTMNLSGAMKQIAAAAHTQANHAAGDHGQSSHGAIAGLAHGPVGRLPRPLRPLVIGVIHGLAGSAAVALLVLATIKEVGWALPYLAVFGLGTVVGMMLLTGIMAIPIAAASKRFASLDIVLSKTMGFVSLAFGVFLAYRIGIVDGLFLSDVTWTPY